MPESYRPLLQSGKKAGWSQSSYRNPTGYSPVTDRPHYLGGMTDSTNGRRRAGAERHRGAVTLRRESIPPSTADEKLLDSHHRREWKTKDAWRALRILSEFVEGFDTLADLPP